MKKNVNFIKLRFFFGILLLAVVLASSCNSNSTVNADEQRLEELLSKPSPATYQEAEARDNEIDSLLRIIRDNGGSQAVVKSSASVEGIYSAFNTIIRVLAWILFVIQTSLSLYVWIEKGFRLGVIVAGIVGVVLLMLFPISYIVLFVPIIAIVCSFLFPLLGLWLIKKTGMDNKIFTVFELNENQDIILQNRLGKLFGQEPYLVINEPGPHIFIGWYKIHEYGFLGAQITVRDFSEPAIMELGQAVGQISEFECAAKNVMFSCIVESKNIREYMLQSKADGVPANFKYEILDYMNELLSMCIKTVKKGSEDVPELCLNDLQIKRDPDKKKPLKLDGFTGKTKDSYLKELSERISKDNDLFLHMGKVKISVGDIDFTTDTNKKRKERYDKGLEAEKEERIRSAEAAKEERTKRAEASKEEMVKKAEAERDERVHKARSEAESKIEEAKGDNDVKVLNARAAMLKAIREDIKDLPPESQAAILKNAALNTASVLKGDIDKI